MCGTAQINGTVTSFTMDVRARNVRQTVKAGDPFMWGAFRVTFEQDDSDAPASYGAASHVISDQAIGKDVTADVPGRVTFQPRRLATADTDGETASGARLGGGQRFEVVVPVTSASPATMAGWIDFNRNRRFDAAERAQTAVTAGASAVLMTWTVPKDVEGGASWMRLRLARDAAELARPDGWASSGEVEDHPFAITGPDLRLSHTASRRKANPGDRVAFVTTVENTSTQARSYNISVRTQGWSTTPCSGARLPGPRSRRAPR